MFCDAFLRFSNANRRVYKKMTKSVTHVVWSNGSEALRNKVLTNEKKISLISPLWVTKCAEYREKLQETDFFPKTKAKKRNRKSMEPSSRDIYVQKTPVSRTPSSGVKRRRLEPEIKVNLFQTLKSRKKEPEFEPLERSICITGANDGDSEVLERAIAKLDAGAIINPKKQGKATHVIVHGTNRRTLKIIFGVANDAWIVTPAWVYESLEANKFLPEADYQVKGYEKVSRREATRLFAGYEIFVCPSTQPDVRILTELLNLANATIVTTLLQSTIAICCDDRLNRRAAKLRIPVVRPEWIFNSIVKHQQFDPKYFLIPNSNDGNESPAF